MRWYWMLLFLAVAALTFSSQEALTTVRHLFPAAVRPAAPAILLALAVLAGFTALLLSSRGFGLVALACGAGALWLQGGSGHALARVAGHLPGRLPEPGTLDVDRMLASLLHSLQWSLSPEMTWMAALGVAALLMASLLTLGARTE